MLPNFLVFSVLVCVIYGKSLPNNTAVLISKYAKVAHWGQNDTQKYKSEGRGSGQTLWAHRSDVNVVSGQNLKKKPPSVTYHYAVSRKVNDKSEIVPGIGEVIQDRFNPKPYFKYGQIPPSKSDNALSSASPTFNSFPVYNPPKDVDAKPSSADAPPKPPNDLYLSPFSSYNPPNVSPSDPLDGPVYPPNTPPQTMLPTPTKDSYAAPPPDSQMGGTYSYKPADSDSDTSPKSSYPSLGPPLALSTDDDMPPMPLSEDTPKNYGGGPPKYPPKSEDDIYYPPDDHQDTIMDHPPMDHSPPMDHKPVDMAEEDLSPPPSDNGQPRFPQYLYDHDHPYDFHHDHHDDHHVYEEIPHPTTPPPQEDKRVSTSHYSYKFLGKKLWYIPLYFSVYFIIYVTILILKSIARHKIEFKHHFDDDKRKARNNNFDDRIDDIHRNVTSSIDNARVKYMAM